MPVAHGKIFCQIYFIKRFMKQNFIKCTLLMEKFYKNFKFYETFYQIEHVLFSSNNFTQQPMRKENVN